MKQKIPGFEKKDETKHSITAFMRQIQAEMTTKSHNSTFLIWKKLLGQKVCLFTICFIHIQKIEKIFNSTVHEYYFLVQKMYLNLC